MQPIIERKVAVLYQAAQPPVKNGIIKPMKPGGYSDSGADIAFALQKAGIAVVTPEPVPDPSQVYDWVFPDTEQGIEQAIALGAQVLWLNTILFDSHPIQDFHNQGISVVGQDPGSVEIFDDKWETNELLRSKGLLIPQAIIVHSSVEPEAFSDFHFPLVVKPIRGRGSAGVSLVQTEAELSHTLSAQLSSLEFGDALMVEEYLPGKEVTLTIMPAGIYKIDGQTIEMPSPWSLPPVERFNHHNGIAPYNGTVAVVSNSQVISGQEMQSETLHRLIQQCEQAASLVNAKAPIRIDCRQNQEGVYFLFDLNMKPNMTGAGRPGRQDQDSLSALAACRIGWSYEDLLLNMLAQQWPF